MSNSKVIAAVAIVIILLVIGASYILSNRGSKQVTISTTVETTILSSTLHTTSTIAYNSSSNTTYSYNDMAGVSNEIIYDSNSFNLTFSIPQNSTAAEASNRLITVALENYKAPYCQGSSQAPVGQNGIPCAQEVGSNYPTFNSVSGAFDCAGFVQYVYSTIGIKIPRTAQAQFGNFYSADAKVVSVPGGQANTVPGDLVYFSIPADHDPEPAHVAMCFTSGCNTIIQDGGPPPGWPGTIAPLDAVLCTNSNANTARCVMGFMQVEGSPIFQANKTQ